jgi:SAM-dependent methyltransferase
MGAQAFAYTGTSTLEVLHEAVRYNTFLVDELVKFADGRAPLLDFGAGIGYFALRLRERGIVADGVEPDKNQLQRLKDDGLTAYDGLEALGGKTYARIYTLNVLEHIEADRKALSDLRDRLTQDGKLFIYVPAFMLLYTEFDKEVGHFRRYTKKELVEKVAGAGFAIERVGYVDSLGFFAWLLMKCLPKKKEGLNPGAVAFYDRYGFPLSRLIDRITGGVIGKNLLLVAKKS